MEIIHAVLKTRAKNRKRSTREILFLAPVGQITNISLNFKRKINA